MFLAQGLAHGKYFIYHESSYEISTCVCGYVFVYIWNLQELRKPRASKGICYDSVQYELSFLCHCCRKFLSECNVTSLCFAYPDSPWKHSTQTACISYFRTAVSEHHDQGSLSKKHLIWRLMVLRVHDHHKGEYGSRQAGVLMEL